MTSLRTSAWEASIVVNNKDNRVFMSRNYRHDSCPFDIYVLKTGIFALEASLLGQIFVLKASNLIGAAISR